MNSRILFFALLILFLGSCSDFQKLLKSSDYDLKYEKALEYYAKGVEIAIKREGPQSIPVADFYMDMANTLDQMYKVNEAKKYYQKKKTWPKGQ